MVDLFQHRHRLVLEIGREALDRPGSAHRIDRVRDSGLRRNDLLGPQRDLRRGLGRESQCFVATIAMEGLRPPQHGCEGLQRDPHDVVVRLLSRERAPGGLRVETQLLRFRVSHAEPVTHDARPQPPRRTELGNLLEEVVVGIEEKRQPPSEPRCVQTGGDDGLDVGDTVSECKRDLLSGGRARLANVVSADRDRVPLR